MYNILYNDYPPNERVIVDNRRFNKTLEGRLLVKESYSSKEVKTKEAWELYDREPEETKPKNYIQLSEDSSKNTCSAGVDGEKNMCGSGKNLYPIMDPRFNLREMAGNMILLEDHLFHEGKRCEDCVRKHALTIEFLGGESVSLDKDRKYTEIINKTNIEFRQFFKDLANKMDQGNLTDEECCKLAQQLRKIRKPLCQQFATFVY